MQIISEMKIDNTRGQKQPQIYPEIGHSCTYLDQRGLGHLAQSQTVPGSLPLNHRRQHLAKRWLSEKKPRTNRHTRKL